MLIIIHAEPHELDALTERLASSVIEQIRPLLTTIIEKESIMSQELDALTAQVAQNTTVAASALTLINGIADRITAAGVDRAALTALATELRNSDDPLAAAITANTPAANVP